MLVLQVALDLNLPPELVLNLAFKQLALVEHFYRYYELAFFLAGQVNMAKFSFTKRLPDFKVVDSPLCAVKHLLLRLLEFLLRGSGHLWRGKMTKMRRNKNLQRRGS